MASTLCTIAAAVLATAAGCGGGSSPTTVVRTEHRPPPPHDPVGPESDVAADREQARHDVRRLVTGTQFACAILADGRASCWGRPWVSEVPPGAFVSLGGGDRHACGMRANGHVECWGPPDDAPLAPPREELVSFESGPWFGCGLRPSMTAVCWGSADSGRTAVPRDRFRRIDVQDPMSCGLRADGTMACWAVGSENLALGRERFESIAVGGGAACGLRADGTIRCVGYVMDHQPTPTATFRSITGGGGICGITTDGDALCFGYDRMSTPPPPPPGPFARVVPGRTFACGIRTDGELACWGISPELPRGPFEELALGERWGCARAADARVACFGEPYFGQTHAPSGTFRAIASGPLHTCAIRTDGSIACWGASDGGRTGAPAGSYSALACGDTRCCAIDEARGTLACWGAAAAFGAPPTERVRSVAMSDFLDCAVLADGRLRCWSNNAQGLDVSAVRDARSVAVSMSEVRALRADGSSICFASVYGSSGGGGAPAPHWSSVACPTGTAVALSAYPGGTYDLDAAGTLHRRVRGETAGVAPIPGTIVEGGPFTSFSSLEGHACAVRREDGAVRCWGDSTFGQTSAPPGRFRAVAVGRAHTCAIRDDATIACWGSYAGGVPL